MGGGERRKGEGGKKDERGREQRGRSRRGRIMTCKKEVYIFHIGVILSGFHCAYKTVRKALCITGLLYRDRPCVHE